MANSFQTHTANGSTATFSWSQIDGYLSTSHLKVYVNNIGPKTVGTDYTLDTTAKTITFQAGYVPALNDYIEIRRETPRTVAGLQVAFSDASVLTAADLNNSQKQALFIAQEAYDTGDGGLTLNSTGTAWDGVTKRIERVGDPLSLSDAATKKYVDSLSLFGAYTVPQSWSFSGTGAKVNFDLVSPDPTCTDPAMFLVEVNGVLQRPVVNYGIASNGTNFQVQFLAAPSSGTNNITVRNFGVARNALDVLPNSSVTDVYLANSAVTTAKIADGSVTVAKLATDSVSTAKIIDANVTDVKLAANSVTTAKIVDANVTAAKLATDSVTTAKIADLNVTTAKIDIAAVTSTKIAASSVTLGQLKATGFASAAAPGSLRFMYTNGDGNLIHTASPNIPLNVWGLPTATINMNQQTFGNLLSGSWTPDLTFGNNNVGISYSSREGTWVKIGDMVYVRGSITLTAKGSSTGSARIRFLPHTANAVRHYLVHVQYTSAFTNLTMPQDNYVEANDGLIQLGQRASAGTGWVNVTDTNFTNTSSLSFSAIYQAAS